MVVSQCLEINLRWVTNLVSLRWSKPNHVFSPTISTFVGELNNKPLCFTDAWVRISGLGLKDFPLIVIRRDPAHVITRAQTIGKRVWMDTRELHMLWHCICLVDYKSIFYLNECTGVLGQECRASIFCCKIIFQLNARKWHSWHLPPFSRLYS